ncbi:Mur ligase family protein, partial [Enterococcus faecalis]|uniref:Mur ligase family protein n=1 Tax=Enterococcus faecalis TaxID=1351 RepID=UPI0022A72F3C
VTGSNGKTTTKDLIAAVLSEEFVTYKTQGNYNNQVGLPYTILHMPDETEKLTLEMGIHHAQETSFLTN